MRVSSRFPQRNILITLLALLVLLACDLFQPTPVKQYLPIMNRGAQSGGYPPPQQIEVTRIVTLRPIVLTQVVEAPVTVEVTRQVTPYPGLVVQTVPVIETVEVTRIVTVTRIVEIPLPTLVPPPEVSYYALPLHYDFEDNFLSTGVVEDKSGNGHDARVVGTVSSTNGLSGGQAIVFDGSGYVQADGNPMAGRDTGTIMLWFKTDYPEANYKLASAGWWNGGAGSGWVLGTIQPEFWSDDMRSLFSGDIVNNPNDFPASAWLHEAVTYDGSRIREYTNGQLVNNWPATGADIGLGQAMVIGGWPQFAVYNFKGAIDEFRLFDYALSQQEIRAIFQQR
jgi:hypothetical protein